MAGGRKKPCFAFARTGKCRNGANCQYSHKIEPRAEPRAGPRTEARTEPHTEPRTERRRHQGQTSKNASASSTENDLRQWRYMIPKQPSSGDTLGQQLGKFFQDAHKLVHGDCGVMQEVVMKLASDGGLHRIRELSDQITAGIGPTQQKIVFEAQMIPLFRTLSHDDVLVSAVLEHSMGIMYNFLYGPNGQRAISIFKFAGDVLSSELGSLSDDKVDVIAGQLEVTLAVLAGVVDLNGAALLNQELHETVGAFEGIFDSVGDRQSASSFLARKHFVRIQKRLGLASAIPEAQPVSKPTLAQATFVIHQDLPGRLSRDGPRHDNDSEDICNIKIMPTTQEILSLRQEYRPINDPEQWHLQGPEGVFDRQFRLLREDTVGQLRDAIRMELDRLQSLGQDKLAGRGRQQGARTYTYHVVGISSINVDRWRGFEFEVCFAQPARLRTMKEKQRQEWWEFSRRMQPDALVCLLNSNGTAVFCSVCDTTPKDAKKRTQSLRSPGSEARNLSSDAEFAFVTLRLVSTDDKDVESILDRIGDLGKRWQDSLVEFPGVLLPSFQPTLLALQRLSKSTDLPFRDLIAPIDTDTAEVAVSTPAYAMAPGFQFDLRPIMTGQDLQLPIRGQFDLKKLQEGSTLDDAQAVALVDSLTRRLALIQGPPGTGKSYTGVALIKVLLHNKAKAKLGPIVCVCYTNHALDQLLEHLVCGGVEQIVRIGSRSKSKLLEPLNLRVVAKKMEQTRTEKHSIWQLATKLDGDLNEMTQLLETYQKADSWTSVKSYLEDHSPHHHAALFGVDDEGWERVQHHPERIIPDWLKQHHRQPTQQDRPIHALLSAGLYSMTRSERAKLHRYWVMRIRGSARTKLLAALASFEDARKQYDQTRQEADLRCLQQANVIGITTTGLARNLDLLRRVRAKVLLCEEAGEVLEAHILTALLPSVEHAILIGDHLQLRPQIQNYELSSENPGGRQYSLDVSLFERLVQPEGPSGIRVPFSVLETQRRMHPSIAQLVRDTLYPRLQDSPSVEEYPPVAGMRKRLFWFDHSEPEANSDQQQAMSTSHSNQFEVEITAALVSHLVRQGVYQASDIAVLTPYLGQLQKLRKRLGSSHELVLNDRDLDDLHKAGFESAEEPEGPKISKTTLLKTLRVATIDNFQGEEAKVVVISLVRSNDKNKCGFLRTSNRINVALSRAKHGMYIIGNSDTSGHVQMWADVLTILKHAGNFGTELELQCPRHPDTSIRVKNVDDFQQLSPEGGCDQKCVQRLDCGHACSNKCHSEILHKAAMCLEPCPRSLPGCDHACPKHCGQPCPAKCPAEVVDMERILPCGHRKTHLPCFQARDLSIVKCEEKVERIVPGCKHKVLLECYHDVSAPGFVCEARCDAVLPCGHTCTKPCHICRVRRDGRVTEDHGACKQACGRNYSTCRHTCTTPCHGGESCPPCDARCENQCSHSKCDKKCHEPCAPCAQEHCDSSCPHSKCSMPCGAPCDWLPCSKRCEKLLRCGHQCPSVCGERCPESKYCQTCGNDDIKDTDVDFILGETYRDINLDESPCIFPQCGHFLTIDSMDGLMDLRKHYEFSPEGAIVSTKQSSEPFSMGEIKTCAKCRASLRNLSRYGRIVRRALLDESTKKFIVWANREYVPLAEQLQDLQHQLAESTEDVTELDTFSDQNIRINGDRAQQLNKIRQLDTAGRYKAIVKLRRDIAGYLRKVRQEEQPFQRVWDIVQNARRRRHLNNNFTLDSSVLQTRGFILASALMLRCDLAIISDFAAVLQAKRTFISAASTFRLELSQSRKDCLTLIDLAASQPMAQVEGHVFFAQYAALERSTANAELGALLKNEAQAHLTIAQDLHAQHPGQARGMLEEIESAEKMLKDSTFYNPVTSEERRAILAAMSTEFSGTGHWYICENGHPFTIGECGMPMELATCPQCGAQIGGRDHRAVEGVRHAAGLEQELEAMRLDG